MAVSYFLAEVFFFEDVRGIRDFHPERDGIHFYDIGRNPSECYWLVPGTFDLD